MVGSKKVSKFNPDVTGTSGRHFLNNSDFDSDESTPAF
jgi:hypothetical protein